LNKANDKQAVAECERTKEKHSTVIASSRYLSIAYFKTLCICAVDVKL